MVATTMPGPRSNDDPLKLIALLARVSELAHRHSVNSVMTGLRSELGDAEFPEFIDFLESTLRVEDSIFRMTRERVVVHIADVDEAGATEVLERLLSDFQSEFASVEPLAMDVRMFPVPAGTEEIRAKVLLPALFAPKAKR
jgi:GGDEF domain-containing protein